MTYQASRGEREPASNVRSATLPHGDEDLLRHAEREEGHAAHELHGRMRPRSQLVGNLREPDDRTGDQLREHRDETGEVDEAPDRGGVVG